MKLFKTKQKSTVLKNKSHSDLLAEIKKLRSEKARLQKELQMDPLTGLFNAKHLSKKLQDLSSKRFLNQEAPALLFMDIDHFKMINETHGHIAAGDILKELGGILRTLIRKEDIAFRYGGDEFVVLVSGGHEGALKVAHRIRKSIEKHRFQVKGLKGPSFVNITLSVGVRIIRQNDTALSILEAADYAMYEAKRRSRNTCVAA